MDYQLLKKTIIISYLLYTISTVAGTVGNKSLLYFGIALGFWILMIRFPVFKKPKVEDVDGKKL